MKNGETLKARLIRRKEIFVTRLTMAILRPFYRHKILNKDRVKLDSDNPIVFLANHAEIYGPIVNALYFPYPVRFWVISKLMFNKSEVRAYLYENTFSKKTFLPV